MGKVIIKNIHGMSWKARVGLLAVCSLVVFTLLLNGWNGFWNAHAAIGNSGWATIYNSTSYPSSASVAYTPAAGSNRLLVVLVSTTRSSVGSQTCSISYGGQALTLAAGDLTSTTPQQHTAIYYLKEAGLQAATTSNFSLTLSGGTSRTNILYATTLTNVDQNAPLTNSRNYNGGTSTSVTTPTFATALTENTNDQPIVILNSSRTSSSTARTVTAATNWALPATGVAGNMTLANSTNVAMRASALLRTIPTSNTTDNSPATIGTGSLASMTGISVKAATTTLGNGVAGTTGNVAPGATGQKLDGFSFVTSSAGTTDSITGLTVTTTNQAAIASMQIWNEAGTTQYFGTVNNPGSDSWTFSGGTAIPVTSTAANFKILVTYKTRAAAAPAGNTTTTARVSTYTSSNIQATGTDTADTTLTLLNSHAASTWRTNTAGNAQITLNWSYGTSGQSVIIIRYTANTNTTKPVDGTTYAVGTAFGTGGTVRYNGTASTFTDSVGITNGVTYYYKIFEYDTYRNYYNATDVWTAGLTPLSPDSVPPAVDAGFAASTPVNTVNIPITSFSATDNTGGSGVAGYLITTSSAQPSAGAAGWSTTPPASFTVAGQGTYALYPWAKDGGGNVSPVYGAPVTVVVDTTAPTVSSFTVTTPVKTPAIPITAFTGADSGGSGVAGYMVTTSNVPPAPDAAEWSASAPATYTVAGDGSYTLYPWTKDSAGNVSPVYAFPRTAVVDSTPPTGLAPLSPADETTGLPVNVTLQCTTAADPSGGVMYWFQIANDTDYSQNSGWIAGTSFTPTGLQQGDNYVWSVKAKDVHGNETAFTTPRSFTTTAPCARNNPTLILLTPAGGIASTITTDGGTSVYNLKVVNNDFGDCGSTTFNLTAEDVDLYQVFDPSTLGVSSMTLIPGAQATTTVTVKATPDHDSGVSKTSVTSAADATHAAITTSSVQTTLNVTTCRPNTPLLIVGPSSGYLNKGGNMVYTVTVKNTDAGAGCSPVDFTLAKVSESNGTDFNASQFSTTILRLNSGEIGSASLTVSAKSTAARNATNATNIRVTAAGHTSPADVTVTSVVNNPMLHNSDNTGSSKWTTSGGWGIPNGKYGEFTCETCHVGGGGDTVNVKRIEQAIITPDTAKGQFPGHGQSVLYQQYVGTATNQPVLGWDAGATPRTSSSKVCEVCHTYDATSVNGSKAHPYSTTATLGNHFNTDGKDCTRCHKHNQGFGAANMLCNSCHGDASASTITAANRYVVAPPVNASGATGTITGTGQVSNNLKVGAHQTHLRYLNGYSNYSTIDYRCQGCHGTLPTDFSHANGSTTLPFQGVASKWGAVTPSYNSGTGKCTNVYCHGGGLTGSGTTDYSPTWNAGMMTGNTGATGDCSKCHQYLPPPQSGAAGSAHSGITQATQCKDCHTHLNASGTGFDNPALHVNGIVEGGTCVSCHGSVKSGDRRQVTGTGGDIDNGMTSHHIKYTALNNGDCGICHDQSNHKTYTDGVKVYLKNLDSGASVLFDGTAANDGEAACVSCHDANGASSLGANAAKPFTASGDNNPPVNVGWTAGSMAHSVQLACFNCHGKSGATNTTLDPKYNAHGSPTAKLLQYSYTAGTEQNFCYNCHGTTPANGAVNAIQPLFAKTRHHSTESCDNCHSKHQAKAGTHTVTGNTAGGVLNGAAGAKLATTPAFWTAPAAGNFTAVTMTSGTDVEATLCFKCHSIYKTGYNTTTPSGAYAMTDIAKEFNPNNKGNWNTTGTLTTWTTGETAGGFHPVLASASGNLGQVNLANLVTTNIAWSTTSRNMMTCSDCHGSDQATDPLGPHGSANNFILRGPNTLWNGTMVATSTGMPTGAFCANCHSATYASSRFATHVSRSNHRVACWNCHAAVPHGGPRPGMLIAPAGAATGVGGTIAGWDTTAPYWRLGTSSSKLYIASYPSGPTTGWGQSNCGCNGTGH